MRFFNSLVAFAAAIVLLAAQAPAASVNDFIDYTLRNELNAVQLPGRLHVPTSFASEPTKLRPLILFLHGSGESGTNNLAQINGNIDNLLTATKARDAFLYAPQTNSGWANSSILSRAMDMIDRAIAERSVDPNRIYVTGLSMGGGGAWNFLHQFADRVAATVPICGVYPSFPFLPETIVNEPIWAFHGRSDRNCSRASRPATSSTACSPSLACRFQPIRRLRTSSSRSLRSTTRRSTSTTPTTAATTASGPRSTTPPHSTTGCSPAAQSPSRARSPSRWSASSPADAAVTRSSRSFSDYVRPSADPSTAPSSPRRCLLPAAPPPRSATAFDPRSCTSGLSAAPLSPPDSDPR